MVQPIYSWKLTKILKVYRVIGSWFLCLTGKPVSVKQVNTRVHPLAAKIATHTYHLAQTVGHGSGSWHTRHSCTAGCVSYCHQTQFWSKPCPFCDNHSTESSHFEHFITCHTPFVSSEFNQTDHRYFCACQAFLHLVSSWPSTFPSCYSFTLHPLYTSCYAVLASYASTIEHFEPEPWCLYPSSATYNWRSWLWSHNILKNSWQILSAWNKRTTTPKSCAG